VCVLGSYCILLYLIKNYHLINMKDTTITKCPICFTSPAITVKLQCNHSFCYECIQKWDNINTVMSFMPNTVSNTCIQSKSLHPIRELRRKIQELTDELDLQCNLLDEWISGCSCGYCEEWGSVYVVCSVWRGFERLFYIYLFSKLLFIPTYPTYHSYFILIIPYIIMLLLEEI
jgi:hypothetical protein